MADLKKFSDFHDFVQFNQEFIESNPLLYYNLESTIQKVINAAIGVYNFFNIVDADCFCSVLHVDKAYLIYANRINDDVVAKTIEELEFEGLNDHIFFGTKQISDVIFNKFNFSFQEIKHRIIYECKKVSDDFILSPGKFSLGDLNRIKELGALHSAFSKKWNDVIVPQNKAQEFILDSIGDNNFYQWELDNYICSVAQANEEHYSFPVIGHVMTNTRFINRGFASSIVYSLTNKLLAEKYDKCMLSADGKNPASNRAFIKVGYTNIGEYVSRYVIK